MADNRSATRLNPWNIGLWAAQGLLAFMFLYAGYVKLTSTPQAMEAMGWHWAVDVSPALIIFIGIMEVLGAIGIIAPAATRILPWLTSAAAAGMVLLQLAAIGLHTSRGEFDSLWLNMVLVAAAAFVFWGRTRKQPILPVGAP
jgi:putative oxidoreductase